MVKNLEDERTRIAVRQPDGVNWFKISRLLFVLCAIVYLIFLVLLRYDLRPSALLYLLPTGAMVAIIAYQIFRHEAHPGSEKLILFEIFTFTLLLHLTRVIPVRAGVFGDDFPPYYYTTKYVLDYDFLGTGSAAYAVGFKYINGWISGLSSYPVLTLNGVMPSLITGLDLMTTMRWLPSIWAAIGILAIYLIGNSIFSDKRAALLAALGFSAYVYSIEYHSQYIRETIAFVILLFTVYAFYAAYRRNRIDFRVLAILFTVSLVLAHYYVSAILLGFLFLFAICTKFIEYMAQQRWAFTTISPTLSVPKVPWSFVILAAVIALGYWLYMELGVLLSLISQVQDVVRYGSFTAYPSPGAVPTLLSQILAYVPRFFNVTFCVILLLEVIRGIRGHCRYLDADFFLAAWVVIIFFILPNILLSREFLLPASRLIPFSIPFMLIGVAHAGSNIKNRIIGTTILTLVVLFVGLHLVSSPIINKNFGPTERVVITIPKEGKSIYTFYPLPQDPQGIAAMNFYSDMENARFTRWFRVQEERVFTEAYEKGRSELPGFKLYTKSYLIISPDSYVSWDRVYDNGEVYIYR